MGSPQAPRVPRAVVAMAARASWLAPAAALLVVGVSAPGGLLPAPVLAGSAAIPVTTAAAVIGLVLGTFAAAASTWFEAATLELRHALIGIGLSALLLVTIGLSSVVGALSGREATEELDRATRAALRDSPSWNGAGRVGGALVSASEVAEGTDLARIMLRSFGVPYRVLLVSIDNSAGRHEVTIDLEHVALHGPSGETRSLPRSELVRAKHADRLDLDDLPALVRVPAGSRADGARVFLPPTASFRDVVAVTLRANGSDRTIPGRYFTLAEKRAIDAQRGAAPH